MRTRGVLALAAPRRSLFSNPESRRQIEAYATLIAIALERLHYVEVAQQALVSMESGCATRCLPRCRTTCARR